MLCTNAVQSFRFIKMLFAAVGLLKNSSSAQLIKDKENMSSRSIDGGHQFTDNIVGTLVAGENELGGMLV